MYRWDAPPTFFFLPPPFAIVLGYYEAARAQRFYKWFSTTPALTTTVPHPLVPFGCEADRVESLLYFFYRGKKTEEKCRTTPTIVGPLFSPLCRLSRDFGRADSREFATSWE